MFKNVVSTQELLSDSQRTNYSSDSALFSLSQRQHSQNEFSQVRTQDLFTQNQSSGTQSENSFPPTRKMSMYDKWMSKGALFKKDSSANSRTGSVPQTSFQQQNQHGRGRDTDDRDMLQQVVNIVQDCNKEVKCTLNAVKEKLETQSELPGDKLNEVMKAFLEDIWKHEDRMLQAIQEGSQTKDKLNELEKQLAMKNAEIKHLQDQLEERVKADSPKQVAKAVRKELLSPHLAVENKLMEILEVTREASEQQSEQLSQYKSQIMAHNKQCSEWKTVNQRLFKDMEKRLQKDIATLRKDLQKEEQEWQNSLQDQLSEACSVNTQDIEKLIERVVSDSIANSGTSNNTTAVSAMLSGIKKELQVALQRQTKSLERNLRDVWKCQVQKQQKQLEDLHSTFLTEISTEIESATGRCHDRYKDESVTPLTMPVFEEKIEECHTDLKKQLEEMHRNHVLEVKRIQNEIQTKNSAPSSTIARIPFTNALNTNSQSQVSAESCIPKQIRYPLQQSKGSKFSPLSDTDRSNLFSKTKPSPGVSVLPQHVRKTSAISHAGASVLDSDSEITFSSQPPKSYGETKPKPKRKKDTVKKRPAVKKQKSQRRSGNAGKIFTTLPISQKTSKAVRHRMADEEKLAVYDFSQTLSPEQSKKHLRDFQVRKIYQEEDELCSPTASTESYVSSPAVSVTVDTELVMFRRSQWQTYSAPKRANHGDTFDMLSSPFLSSTLQNSVQQQVGSETLRRETRSRSAAKRKS